MAKADHVAPLALPSSLAHHPQKTASADFGIRVVVDIPKAAALSCLPHVNAQTVFRSWIKLVARSQLVRAVQVNCFLAGFGSVFDGTA